MSKYLFRYNRTLNLTTLPGKTVSSVMIGWIMSFCNLKAEAKHLAQQVVSLKRDPARPGLSFPALITLICLACFGAPLSKHIRREKKTTSASHMPTLDDPLSIAATSRLTCSRVIALSRKCWYRLHRIPVSPRAICWPFSSQSTFVHNSWTCRSEWETKWSLRRCLWSRASSLRSFSWTHRLRRTTPHQGSEYISSLALPPVQHPPWCCIYHLSFIIHYRLCR